MSEIRSRRKERVRTKHMEKGWLGNFQLVCSRDNEALPKYQRELFDFPMRYDVDGNRVYFYPFA